jgi:hypothetical protein
VQVRVVLTLLALAGSATAQPAPEPPPPAEPVPPSPSDPAWQVYDEAFALAARGDRAAAHHRLAELAARWPGHPAAMQATSLVGELAPRPLSPHSKVARGELAFWSTVGGVFIAANVCVIAECSTDRETAAVYTISVGGSLALALVASRNGVEQGEAQLYNSAQTWGSWNGLAINNDFASETDQAATALAAQGAGLIAGIGLWQAWRPTQGDVALTNTFFLWSTVLSLWGHLAADSDVTLRRTVIAGDIGIVAGALVSTQVKMSRGRTLLIDIGGVLGILAGGLVAINTDSEQGVGTSLLLGTGLGLGIAALATDDWDVPDTKVTVSPTRLTDPRGQSVWGVSAGFGF